MADKVKLNLELQFNSEQEKKDFEASFYGWVKQYQQVATIQNYVASQTTDELASLYVNFVPGI